MNNSKVRNVENHRVETKKPEDVKEIAADLRVLRTKVRAGKHCN
jgi:hypothetical protein